MTKKQKPRKRPWWKWWGHSQIREPLKEIAYNPKAKETGTTRTK